MEEKYFLTDIYEIEINPTTSSVKSITYLGNSISLKLIDDKYIKDMYNNEIITFLTQKNVLDLVNQKFEESFICAVKKENIYFNQQNKTENIEIPEFFYTYEECIEYVLKYIDSIDRYRGKQKVTKIKQKFLEKHEN